VVKMRGSLAVGKWKEYRCIGKMTRKFDIYSNGRSARMHNDNIPATYHTRRNKKSQGTPMRLPRPFIPFPFASAPGVCCGYPFRAQPRIRTSQLLRRLKTIFPRLQYNLCAQLHHLRCQENAAQAKPAQMTAPRFHASCRIEHRANISWINPHSTG
jgi:hypothetical protein